MQNVDTGKDGGSLSIAYDVAVHFGIQRAFDAAMDVAVSNPCLWF